jgi:predicted nucleic acid-binding protein
VRPRGRPPLERGVRSFEDAGLLLPPAVAVDTSFVVEALVGSQPLRDPCLEFLLRLAAEGTAIAYSRLLEIELAEAAVQLALKERHPRDWRRYRHDGRALRRASRLLDEAADAWNAVADSLGATCVDVGDVGAAARGLMGSHGLGSYDAVHVAAAFQFGVRDLVTVDAGFAHVPEALLTLWVDRSRVGACRRRRTRT